jgi:hypothetical protein
MTTASWVLTRKVNRRASEIVTDGPSKHCARLGKETVMGKIPDAIYAWLKTAPRTGREGR